MARAREYEAEGIVVRYDARRCIHAEECVHGLPDVFNPDRRPWVDASAASPDAIASVVMMCPTGALQFERTDGGPSENAPDSNWVSVAADGPLYVSGDIELTMPDGEVRRETRVALCRCGASKNKPYCDNSHLDIRFADAGALADGHMGDPPTEHGNLAIKPSPNGPFLFEGSVELRDAVGSAPVTGSKGWLCRCGKSERKPYCDGTHKKTGFEAD